MAKLQWRAHSNCSSLAPDRSFNLQPEGLFTTLVDTAVSSDKNGLKVLSAHLISPGKYEEASAYFRKFMTEFFDIEGFSYEIRTWMTIEEAMESIGQKAPER